MEIWKSASIAIVTAMLLVGCGGGGGGSHTTGTGDHEVTQGGSSGNTGGSSSGSTSGSSGESSGGSSETGSGTNGGSTSSGSGSTTGGSSSGSTDTGENNTVTLSLKGADWAAYSASPWQVINLTSLDTDKTFTFTAASDGRFGIAVHCENDGNGITIYQATVSEIPAIGWCEEEETDSTYSVSGEIRGLNGTVVSISMDGDGTSGFPNSKVFSYRLNAVEKGTADLMAADIQAGLDGTDLLKVGIKRDIVVDHNITDLDLDLESEGISLISRSITVEGGGNATAMFTSKNGSTVMLGSSNGATLVDWKALQSATIEGDVYTFVITNQTGEKMIMESVNASSDPGDRSYNPSIIADYNISVQRQENILFSNIFYTPTNVSPAVRTYDIFLSQDNPDVSWNIIITPGWIEGKTTYTVPSELQSLPGWKKEWSLNATNTIDWDASVTMSNISFYDAKAWNGNSSIAAGTLVHYVKKSGELTAE